MAKQYEYVIVKSPSSIKSILIGLLLFSLLASSCICHLEDPNFQAKTIETVSTQDATVNKSCGLRLNKITGRVFSLPNDDVLSHRRSLMETTITMVVDSGIYTGYPREDGTFEIDNVPPESYVVQVNHPKYIYEPFRVDITSKTGKIRARRVNNLKPSEVQTVEYPLVFKPRSIHNYFTPRETWRLMDLILNPMVIMMLIPLVVIWLLPKMMSPQDVQSQQENMQLPEYNVPELSEVMANMFGRQGSAQGSGSGNLQIGSSGAGDRRSKNRKRDR